VSGSDWWPGPGLTPNGSEKGKRRKEKGSGKVRELMDQIWTDIIAINGQECNDVDMNSFYL
jgi:hypothetical protein